MEGARRRKSPGSGRIRTWSSFGRRESCCIRRRSRAVDWETRRTDSSTGSPQRVSHGGRCSRSVRPTSSARRTGRRRRSPASTGLLADPQAPVTADEIEHFVAQRPYWTGEWVTVGHTRRPGALPAGVERAARLRARSRRAADRRRPDLRLRRGRRHRGVAGAVRARRCRRRAARSAERERAALGQPAVRLAGASRAPGSAGGSSASRGPSSSSTSPASTTSAASSRTGRSRRVTRPRGAAAGAARPGASCSRRSSARSATCR